MPGNFNYVSVDLTTPEGPAALAASVTEPLDLVVLAAGVYGPGSAGYNPGSADQDLGTLTAKEALEVLAINAVAPLMTIQALVEHMRRADSLPVVAVLGSQVGSLGQRTRHGDLYYAPSKAAVNMVVRSLAALRPLPAAFVAIDPGWVRTQAGGAHAPDAPDNVADDLVDLFMALTEADNGRFIDRSGRPIPW